jgi:hypothetical protein
MRPDSAVAEAAEVQQEQAERPPAAEVEAEECLVVERPAAAHLVVADFAGPTAASEHVVLARKFLVQAQPMTSLRKL